jgi:dCMP deaminase
MRPDWDTYFMNIADVVRTRSLDFQKVGAVLVSCDDNRIISTGYNGVRSGLDDSKIDWNDRSFVSDVIIHAETNAILYAQSKFENATLYSTHSPCKTCIKLLSATNIKKIVYKEEHKDIAQVKDLCNYYSIEMMQYCV